MSEAKLPLYADENYKQYIERIESLKKAPIGKAIPKELYQKNVFKSMTGFLVSYSLYLGSIFGVAYAPHWAISVLFLISAGLGGWGLHCIAHDCGHGSFSNSKTLNYIVGHLSLIPLLYPFHSWRHVHNMHHGSTNNLEMDTDWRPVSKEVYDRMPLSIDWLIYSPVQLGFGLEPFITGGYRHFARPFTHKRNSVTKYVAQWRLSSLLAQLSPQA